MNKYFFWTALLFFLAINADCQIIGSYKSAKFVSRIQIPEKASLPGSARDGEVFTVTATADSGMYYVLNGAIYKLIPQTGTIAASYLTTADSIAFQSGTVAYSVSVSDTASTKVLAIDTATGKVVWYSGKWWRDAMPGTPADSSDSGGAEGDIWYDNSYLYIKAAGGWRRVAISTF